MLARSLNRGLDNDYYNSYRDLIFHFNNISDKVCVINELNEKTKSILSGFAKHKINSVDSMLDNDFFRGRCRNVELEREYKLMRHRQTAYMKYNPLYEKKNNIFFLVGHGLKPFIHIYQNLLLYRIQIEKDGIFLLNSFVLFKYYRN